MFHKNSYLNPLPHHLYQIIDKIDDDVFKYGISCEPIGADGMSDRMRKQVNFLNLVDDWERFFAVIILYDIQGKIEAKQIETEYIRLYELKNGRKPRGNIRY
jgi:URI fold toxin 2